MPITQLLFAVIIVLGILGALAIQNHARHSRATRGKLDDLEQEIRGRLAQLDRLEERIAVVEKIVTDRRYEIDEQLRKLGKTG